VTYPILPEPKNTADNAVNMLSTWCHPVEAPIEVKKKKQQQQEEVYLYTTITLDKHFLTSMNFYQGLTIILVGLRALGPYR